MNNVIRNDSAATAVNPYNGKSGSVAVNDKGVLFTSTPASTSGGWTPYNLVSAANTNATSLKASPGQVGYINVGSINAAARYLHLYNKASAPTVGTDTPVHTFIIPGNTAGAGNSLPIPAGTEFTTGIAFAITTSINAANSAVAANEITVNIGYK